MSSPSSSSIGVNLRVTGHCNQGGRKYMEDVFSVAYQQTEDDKDLEYAFFGIFDGHGGREAAIFAKEHLMDSITKQKNFWSDDDELVLKSIREGFLSTQQAMWRDQTNWKPTASGLPSTAGTTASICFIKRGKLFVGHCGDSGIVLGEEDPQRPGRWRARALTTDHKPESEQELARIEKSGGKVVNKSGVPRVVWYRPRRGHQGTVRRSTPIDEVPFLAVARALGDLWSYNAKDDVFIVSPDPDLHVYSLDILKHRCLILATDGAWNVLSQDMAVQCVFNAEKNNERHMINPMGGSVWLNPSKNLVDLAIARWNMCKLRADNTSIVTVMLDPPGPPRAQVLRRLHGIPMIPMEPSTAAAAAAPPKAALAAPLAAAHATKPPALPPKPSKGIAIISRFPNSRNEGEKHGTNLIGGDRDAAGVGSRNAGDQPALVTRIVHDSLKSAPHKLKVVPTGQQQQRKQSPPPAGIKSQVTAPVPKSPSPPPLPARPTNLMKFPSSNLASANNYLRTRNRSSSAGGRLIGSPAPVLPVKQVRRSIVPEYNSDSENQPQRQQPPQAKKPPVESPAPFCRSTRQSCGQLLKAQVSRGLFPQQKKPQHVGIKLPSAASPLPPPHTFPGARALRPRNQEGGDAVVKNELSSPPPQPQKSPRRVTRSKEVFQETHQADPNASGGIKRKRRSFDSVPSKLQRMNMKHVRSCTWNNTKPGSSILPPPPQTTLNSNAISTAGSAKKPRAFKK